MTTVSTPLLDPFTVQALSYSSDYVTLKYDRMSPAHPYFVRHVASYSLNRLDLVVCFFFGGGGGRGGRGLAIEIGVKKGVGWIISGGCLTLKPSLLTIPLPRFILSTDVPASASRNLMLNTAKRSLAVLRESTFKWHLGSLLRIHKKKKRQKKTASSNVTNLRSPNCCGKGTRLFVRNTFPGQTYGWGTALCTVTSTTTTTTNGARAQHGSHGTPSTASRRKTPAAN